MAAGPKAAAFASFLRVFLLGFPVLAGAQAAGYLHDTWITAVSLIAIATMTLGNVGAIMQNNVKRMLAYSSIAHAGYALVGFVGAEWRRRSPHETKASHRLRSICLRMQSLILEHFAIITLLAKRRSKDRFRRFQRNRIKSPALSFTLSLFMLSLPAAANCRLHWKSIGIQACS
jgi:NADH-quinone oxidoreductase subunit N